MQIKFDDLVYMEHNTKEITEISLNEQVISDFEILYKYENLEFIKINFCHFNYEDYLKFDFSKLKELRTLELTNNYHNCLNYTKDTMLNLLVEKFNYPKEIFNILIDSYYLKDNFIKNINKYNENNNLNININELETKFTDILNHCCEIEIDFYKNKEKKIQELPLNESIFNCKLIKKLNIDKCKLKEFFNKLPDECELLNSLELLFLNDHNDTAYYLYYSNNSPNFYKYKKEHGENYLFDVSDIEKNSDICKITLFKYLNNNIFYFFKSDYSEYTAISKNKTKAEHELMPIGNLILYYKNYCYAHLIYNEYIKFREDITNLKLVINRLDYAFDNNFDNNILCLSSLPNLQNLKINCSNEYHDNFLSMKYSTHFEFENIPPTLENLIITGIDKETTDNLKIPFGCNVEYDHIEDF